MNSPTEQSSAGGIQGAPASNLLKAFCGVLIAIPVVLALSIPLYQRTDPTLFGIPFFFWFQMTMAVAAAVSCGTTYLLIFRNESELDR